MMEVTVIGAFFTAATIDLDVLKGASKSAADVFDQKCSQQKCLSRRSFDVVVA